MNASCSNCSSCNCTQEDKYEEFIPYQEYAIGEFFKIKNEVYKVAHSTDSSYSCEECDFFPMQFDNFCEDFPCGPKIAILYDTLEENE